ncbi:hypothetical protein M2272_001487 [Mycobacterium frederiksbergense]|uniref:Uncharacterized protein n=1 Tax=Mycolicibacterium frederiksbergense TaxID=117567 RepID=A0ABT6KVW7_9MYCO|nr:hypothetical protein [Mycolicibacterium frederiksbergense]MDH6194858.1 hypothetical protein [Mycolicibacterium frederiksbergense]
MAQLTAQSRYDEMIKQFISPTLRGQGWVGSGGRYRRACSGVTERLKFQKSRFSSRQSVQFRVNASRKSAGGAVIGAAVLGNPWWTMAIDPDFDPEAEVDSVLSSITGWGQGAADEAVVIDCARVADEAAFWRLYLESANLDGASVFGRDLDTLRDALLGVARAGLASAPSNSSTPNSSSRSVMAFSMSSARRSSPPQTRVS